MKQLNNMHIKALIALVVFSILTKNILGGIIWAIAFYYGLKYFEYLKDSFGKDKEEKK
jgi:branched-subunit amino acid transport protein